MAGDVLRMLPVATLLRADRDVAIAATRAGQTVHVLNRPGGKPLCGRQPRKLTAIELVDQLAPPMRVCTLCARALPAAIRASLAGAGRPTPTELAAVHEHAARQAAQACVDRLADIRSASLADGSAGQPVELFTAVPAHAGPRPATRAGRARARTGFIAGAERMTLAALLARLTPCGFGPGRRTFITAAPGLGAVVDPDAPVAAVGGAR